MDNFVFTMNYLYNMCFISGVSNIDEIFAFPSMQIKENQHRLYSVCANGLGKSIIFDRDERVFLENLNNIYSLCYTLHPMQYSIDESVPMDVIKNEIVNPLENFYQFMVNGGIYNAQHLIACKWFCHNANLQEKVFRVIIKNKGHLVNVFMCNFEKHINSILS